MLPDNGGRIYANFASVYDYLMADIPYQGWIEYLQKLLRHYNLKPARVLDLGCGTGNISIPMAVLGYEVTGVDLSPEMLALAEQKARQRGLGINFFCQDMRRLSLPGSFDLVISMVDSFNYLTEDGDVQQTLAGVYSLLQPGGLLVFDLNSAYKIEKIFGNNTYTLLDEKVCYIWENFYDPKNKVCELEVTFFVKTDRGCYERFTECHRERAFDVEDIEEFLSESGFQLTDVYGELSFDSPQPEEERIFIVAQKL